MAAPTTLKLPEELKLRIALLARAEGKTPHAWRVEALHMPAELAQLRADFLDDALAAAAEVDAGGPLYAAQDVRACIVARAAGRPAVKPRPGMGGRKRTAR